VSFNKQSASLLFTYENKIGFLKIQRENKNLKSGFGHAMCKAAHYISLVDAQVDYMSASIVYGLSKKSNEVFIFKTSNLMITPEANDCKFLTKFSLPDEMAKSHEIRMTAVKGGLFLSSDEGQINYFNTSALVGNKHGSPAMFNLGDADRSFDIY